MMLEKIFVDALDVYVDANEFIVEKKAGVIAARGFDSFAGKNFRDEPFAEKASELDPVIQSDVAQS